MLITNKFKEFTEKHNVFLAVLVDVEKGIDYTYGSKDNLIYEGLFNSLFGNMESIIKLNKSLDGQIMPQSWKQGELKCLVVRPNDKVLIGLFYNDVDNVLESYKIGK